MFVSIPHPFLLTFFNVPIQSLLVSPESQLAMAQSIPPSHILRNGVKMKDDALVIHFRCGDVFSRPISPAYGFLGLTFYEQIVKETWDWKGNQVFVIAQVMDTGHINAWHKKHMDKCAEIVKGAISLWKAIFGADVEFHIVGLCVTVHYIYLNAGDGTINEDYELMSNAPYLLCGISSFCFHAALFNDNQIAMAVQNLDVFLKNKVPLETLKGKRGFRKARGDGRVISDRFLMVEHLFQGNSRLLNGPTVAHNNYSATDVLDYMRTH